MLILRLLGGLFLALGAVGLVLPIWPTTIFWIMAALCFARSSPKTRDWIYARPGVGPVIHDFVEFGRVSRKSKMGALFGIALAGLISGFALRTTTLPLYATLATLAIVATYVATRRES